MSKLLASLERGMDILCTFDRDNEELSAQQLATRLDLPISTLYRYLELLIARNFLRRNPKTKRYSLGLTLFKLGQISAIQLNVVDVATRHMEELSRESMETVFLTALNEWESVCVKKIEVRRRIRLSIDEGSILPLHAGASSRVLLAYQSEGFLFRLIERSGLPRLTDNTITDPEKLSRELALTRQRGVAVSDSEVDYGGRSVAAPVFDHLGKLAGGLSIAGPVERFNDEVISRFIELVKDYAGRISRGLGYE